MSETYSETFKTPEDLVDKIHATRTKTVIIVTGGGTEILPMLLKRGGGSATLLSAVVPYEQLETDELLGGKPEKYVSEDTTRKLAMAAYQKAVRLSNNEIPVIGVACSSSLQKTPTEREGRIHYIFAALQTGNKTVSLSLVIDPAKVKDSIPGWTQTPTNIRSWEETLNAKMVLNLIAEGCGISADELLPLHGDTIRLESAIECPFFPAFLSGEIKDLVFMSQLGLVCLPMCGPPKFLLSGSFNPMHPGHVEMMEYVEKHSGEKVELELSIRNVDKPLLDFVSIEERLSTTGNRDVWLTNAATFVEKAAIFPGTTFIVGYDTALRIINPKYAGDIDAVVDAFRVFDTRFIVFGREINGVYYGDLEGFPERFAELCTPVIEKLDHCAVSSTGIRNKAE
jgi:hypothetical protein